MNRARFFFGLFLLSAPIVAYATVFATIHGVVHDTEHRPIPTAQIKLKAANSSFTLTAVTSSVGEFDFSQVPIGVYSLEASASGFASSTQTVTIASGTNPVLHIPLMVGPATQSITVEADAASNSASDTVTPTTLITRQMIDKTPGATATTGMQMITDYVPGSYMTHDMLHIRGGHQTSWLIDGVSIPNTKIASNVGPQIDPKDIDQLETQRGSYGADIGDRTYGVFNVLPRNGFERDREAELLLYAGNFYSGEAQLSLGDHSSRTAWYASFTGSRSSYGLATPIPQVLHDITDSGSAFASLIRNQTPKDQLRLDAQFRQDFFQIPYDPVSSDYECSSDYYCSYGLRDGQTERDSFVIANWVHTVSPKAMFSFAPFFHFNQSNYDSRASDLPVATTWHQTSNYIGGQADARDELGPNSLSAGVSTFYQSERDLFGTIINDNSANSQPNTQSNAGAALAEFYVADHLRLGRYVTLLGGERFSVYRAGIDESAIYPRIGASFQIPRLHWVLRGFYGHFFQPAPIQTVSASVLNYASNLPGGENTFTPLASERDEEHQFGIEIPWRGWNLDVDTFRNRISNFLDHSNLGESNMYFPIAVDGALVRAWEMSLRSPDLAHLGRFYVTYSNQIAEQRGNIIGGFTCTDPSDPACNLGPDYTPVDHDQRNTLNTGFTVNLPLRTWFAANVYYGSGFTNGLAGADTGPYNGAYLPVHTTFDISTGYTFHENWSLTANILNVTNHRILLDNSVTIGGFHYNDPRMVSAQLRYRFHF